MIRVQLTGTLDPSPNVLKAATGLLPPLSRTLLPLTAVKFIEQLHYEWLHNDYITFIIRGDMLQYPQLLGSAITLNSCLWASQRPLIM